MRTTGLSWASIDLELDRFDLVKDARLKWYGSLAVIKCGFFFDCGTFLFFWLHIAPLVAIAFGMGATRYGTIAVFC